MFEKNWLSTSGVVGMVFGVALSVTWAENPIPPFAAKGTILVEDFRPGETAPYYTIEADVSFYSSNKWWQVEVRPKNPAKGDLALQSCMRIPDGIRTYHLFKDDTREGMTAVDVCPIAYPIPGNWIALYTWLSLCPNPELPIIDPGRMRRFINIPNCAPKLFTHPENEGSFTLGRLQPENAFLSELAVDNNGISIGLGADQTAELIPFRPPFDSGFTELTHRMLESTNLNGLKFPLKTVIKRYIPNWLPEARDSLFMSSIAHLSVHELSTDPTVLDERTTAPQRVLSIDSRPLDLPNNRTVDYVVTNGLFSSVSHPNIQTLAKILRQENNPPNNNWKRAVLIAILIALPAIAFIVRSRQKNKPKNNNNVSNKP
jgi:hypothetical protein